MLTSTPRMAQAITPPCSIASMKPNALSGAASPAAAARMSISMRVVLSSESLKTWGLIQLIDDCGRVAARRRVAGGIQRRIEPGITAHAGASRIVENRRPARRTDGAIGDAAVRPNRDAHADAALDLVANRARRVVFLDPRRPAGET